MNVKELKAILDKLPEEDLELDVAVFADHGQTAEMAGEACPEWVTKDGEADLIADDDLPNWDAEEVERMFVIG